MCLLLLRCIFFSQGLSADGTQKYRCLVTHGYVCVPIHKCVFCPRPGAVSPWSMVPCFCRMVLEIKCWVLGVLAAPGVSLLVGSLVWENKELGTCIYEPSYLYLPRKILVCKCICIKLNISLCGLLLYCVTTGSVLTPALRLSNFPFLETDRLLIAFFPFRVLSQYRYRSIRSLNQHPLEKLSWKTVLTCSSFCLQCFRHHSFPLTSLTPLPLPFQLLMFVTQFSCQSALCPGILPPREKCFFFFSLKFCLE